MKHKALFWFLSLFFLLQIGGAPARADTKTPEKNISCADMLPRAVENFVRVSFPNQAILHTLQAYNDVRCEKPENMANVAISVVKNREEQFYGVFHLHYHDDGSLPDYLRIGEPDSNDWIPATIKREWQKKWCELIHYVYPEEKEKFKCEQFLYD